MDIDHLNPKKVKTVDCCLFLCRIFFGLDGRIDQIRIQTNAGILKSFLLVFAEARYQYQIRRSVHQVCIEITTAFFYYICSLLKTSIFQTGDRRFCFPNFVLSWVMI